VYTSFDNKLKILDLEKIKEFGNIEFLAKQMVEGFITGLHKSPYHGFSVEFAEHRLYNPGESTRHIDWKVFARTDKLFVKRYEEETNLRCRIILDNSSSMYYPAKNKDKITFSIMAAASLAYMLHKQRDAVGLTTFSDEVEIQTRTKSTSAHLHSIFLQLQRLLDKPPKNKKTAITKVIHQLADQISKRSLVVIFSDMADNLEGQEELFAALQHLKHNQHEVILFHVNHKASELNFDFEQANRPHEFIDLETGERVKVRPSEIEDFYKKSMKKRFDELKLKCGQYKIDFIEVDVEQNIEQILYPYLIKRSKMR
jgi:uncharacterized protein (DUF58 family)